MNSSVYSRLSIVILTIHGLVEILALLVFVLPPDLIPSAISDDAIFWGLIGGMYGILRLVSAHGIHRGLKHGYAFGAIISAISIAGAPNIQPFGLMDLPLSAIVLWCILTVWFHNERIQ